MLKSVVLLVSKHLLYGWSLKLSSKLDDTFFFILEANKDNSSRLLRSKGSKLRQERIISITKAVYFDAEFFLSELSCSLTLGRFDLIVR